MALFIQNCMEFCLLPDLPETESVWCKVKFKDLAIVIGGIYRSANSSDIFGLVIDYLAEHRFYEYRLVITSDFNTPCIDWKNLTSTGHEKLICDSLINIAVSYDLTQVIEAPTRENSLLDLVFVSDDLLQGGVKQQIVEGLSDHRAVLVDFNVTCEQSRPSYRTVADFSRADDASIVSTLASYFDNFLFSSSSLSVDALYNQFCNIVTQCMTKFVPNKCVKRHPKHPWYTREIVQLIRRIKRSRRRCPPDDRNQNGQLYSMKSSLKAKMKEAKEFYYNHTLSTFMKDNPSKF